VLNPGKLCFGAPRTARSGARDVAPTAVVGNEWPQATALRDVRGAAVSREREEA